MGSVSSEAKLNVLVVDDNDSIRDALTILLLRRGYRCESASNGREAIEMVARAHFDVVITDVHMPEMDGITLTKEVTRNFSDLPVMIMTGQLDESLVESAIRAGAKEVLEKPFVIQDFMVRLHRILLVQEAPGKQRA